MPEKAPEVIAFIDTNFCLNYLAGDTLDWKAALNVDRIRA